MTYIAKREMGIMKNRSIVIGLPSLTPKMVLFEGYDDEVRLPIRAYKRGKPYVMYMDVKYYLTEEEVKELNFQLDILKGVQL